MNDEDAERVALAQRVRTAVLEAVLAAYEEAGMAGLCAEGRLDYAIDRARHADLEPVLEDGGRTEPSSLDPKRTT